MKNNLQIIRKHEVLSRLPFSLSTLCSRIDDKLFIPPVSLGGRAVGFVSSEVDCCIAAMVAGKNNDELTEIVAELIENRQTTLNSLFKDHQSKLEVL